MMRPTNLSAGYVNASTPSAPLPAPNCSTS
jgi:hypothetical protein